MSWALLSTMVYAEIPNLQEDGTLAPFSAKKTLASIEVPEGYKLQLVASEPMMQEPVSFVFDADGAMFVCEWNTYMQDQYATAQHKPNSRIVKLEDTDGDGKMDKRTVFADGLLLPRSILALHDRILVRFTHNDTIWSYFDDNGDGVSDRKEIAIKGRSVGGNIEHQDNSLIWNMDNKIYATGQTYHYSNGKLKHQKTYGRYGQWGLTRDDVGRIYGSGNSTPVHNGLNLGGYPLINPRNSEKAYEANFTCEVDDATDPGRKVTSTGGQAMIRSSQLAPFKGQLVIPDPVRRMVKMVSFPEKQGLVEPTSSPLFKDTEFLRSNDAYFRPVWTGMGPDGGLYIADMSRGIVQESQWFPTELTKNPNKRWLERYYRTKAWGMLKVNSRGRIYRLVPEDLTKLEKKPQLSKKSSSELLPLLEHSNGWWRDTAHKLIVCRGDQSIIPQIKLLLKSDKPLARIGALRILEEFKALELEHILTALKDNDQRVRTHGICLAEPHMDKNPAVITALSSLISDKSSMVLVQLHSSVTRGNSQQLMGLRKSLVSENPGNRAIALLESKRTELSGHLKKYAAGHKIYQSLCFDCHGQGDKGIVQTGQLFAPKFTDNNRVKDKEYLTKVILHGIQGPLGENKETYSAGIMPPLGMTYNDKQVAEVLNYIGHRWGGWKKDISEKEVAGTRKNSSDRKIPWTYKEIIMSKKKATSKDQ